MIPKRGYFRYEPSWAIPSGSAPRLWRLGAPPLWTPLPGWLHTSACVELPCKERTIVGSSSIFWIF
jgi:hypothetical protein